MNLPVRCGGGCGAVEAALSCASRAEHTNGTQTASVKNRFGTVNASVHAEIVFSSALREINILPDVTPFELSLEI